VETVHRGYLKSLAKAAWADGVVTDAERRDLVEVTRLFGFDMEILDVVLHEARSEPKCTAINGTNKTLVGKSVCFTGMLVCSINGEPISRDKAHELAAQAGLIVRPGVTQTLDILVAADTCSFSGNDPFPISVPVSVRESVRV
jgi:DNA polymerase III subunit epsilon